MLRNVLDRTRTTLAQPTSDKSCFSGSYLEASSVIFENCVVTGDRKLQLFFPNEECPVGAAHQAVPIASLAFVHTARRCARLAVA